MNPAMWRHPATAEAVDRLARWGVRFIQPGDGRTACGEEGEGRLAEPPEIVARHRGGAGAPAQAPAGARDKRGHSRAHRRRARTHERKHRAAPARALPATLPAAGTRSCSFALAGRRPPRRVPRGDASRTFADLDAALTRILSSEPFDAVVHAAAVSDFGVAEVIVDGAPRQPGAGKLDSDSAPLLRLRPHPKLVDTLRARSMNESIRVVAFKLTGRRGPGGHPTRRRLALRPLRGRPRRPQRLAERAGADAFPSEIHFPDGGPPERCATRPELAAALERLLVGMPAAEAALA